MQKTIKCKNCGEEIEVSEALSHQIEEELMASLKTSHKAEIEKAKKTAVLEAEKKAEADLEEARERNKKLAAQLDELLDEIRKLRRKDEERELEMKKKLMEEEEKIRIEARKKAEEEHYLKDSEKDKKLTDALKQIDTLKQRIEQGSQQTQGEVLEIALEELLKNEYPTDEIEEIKKGQRGADIVHRVIDKKNRDCGTILWESKNAKWSDGWLAKLRADQRACGAHLAVLVATNPPDEVETFRYRDGVWITRRQYVAGLSMALRFDLIHLHHQKLANVGKSEKAEVLYEYLTGTEFRHRIEAVAEAFTNLQTDIEKEKRWMTIKWARQEKEIRKIIESTHGLWGDLQAVTGRQLQPVSGLALEEAEIAE